MVALLVSLLPHTGWSRESRELAKIHKLLSAKKYTAAIKNCRQLGQKFRDKRNEPKFTTLCGLVHMERHKISGNPVDGGKAVKYLQRSVQTFYSPSVLIRLGEARALAAIKHSTFERGLREMWEGIERRLAEESYSPTPSNFVVGGLVSYVDTIAKAVQKYPKRTAYLRVLDVRLKNAWARLENIDPQKYTKSKMQNTVKAVKLYLADGAKAGDFDNGNMLAGIHRMRGRWYQRLYYAKPASNNVDLKQARYHLRTALAKTQSPIDKASLHHRLAELEGSCESKNATVVLQCMQRALTHIESALSQKHQPGNRIQKQRQLYGNILHALVFMHLKRNKAGDQQAVVHYAEAVYQAKLANQGQDRIFRMAAVAADELNNKEVTLRFAEKAYRLAFAKYGLDLNKSGISRGQIARDARLLMEVSYYAKRFGEYEQARFYQGVCARFKEKGCKIKMELPISSPSHSR